MKNTTWVKLACAGGMALASVAVAIQVLAAPSGWLNVDGNIRFAGGGGTVDWANAGPAGAACANGGVNVTGSGGLFNCGRPGLAGAPPIAPTLTPAAAANASIISATFIVDPIAGDSSTCGAGDPTTLGGTNGDALNTYSISQSNPPPKDDLANIYAVSHTRSDTGHPELYFAAERLVNNGDSHIDFEFLQSVVTRTAACGGTFVGNRTEGDLLVAVDYTNGGALAGTTVYMWHCAALPAPQPPDGTICDPGAGALYEAIAIPAAITIAVNAVDIPCGGWICRNSGGVTATVLTNDFVEGGLDLQGIGFTGCFNTFLPHTRTSAPFNAQLKDFAGPVALKSCRDPGSTSSPGGTVNAGTAVHDVANLTNGGAPPPSGTVTFFLCSPAQVTGTGCSSGTQVGGAVALVGGTATSASTSATASPGRYCWRLVFAPAAGSTGIYTTTHTNTTTECFNVVATSLPDTGIPEIATHVWSPLAPAVLVVALLPLLVWRRGRSVAALLVAGLVLGASPAAAPAPQATIKASTAVAADNPTVVPSPAPLQLATMAVREAGWRLVIPRIGVDAPIAPVGRDRKGAMASPASLDGVGWFNRGPAPGQPGDAVIDGHYGVEQPAVFRKLHFLRPGDEVDVVWPDGHTTYFQVTSLQTVPADSHPTGLFSRAGPSSLSLITCAGAWLPARATYSDRLIVTAMLS
jgi:LPXTG-site transpeptidase (sortase) family protein